MGSADTGIFKILTEVKHVLLSQVYKSLTLMSGKRIRKCWNPSFCSYELLSVENSHLLNVMSAESESKSSPSSPSFNSTLHTHQFKSLFDCMISMGVWFMSCIHLHVCVFVFTSVLGYRNTCACLHTFVCQSKSCICNFLWQRINKLRRKRELEGGRNGEEKWAEGLCRYSQAGWLSMQQPIINTVARTPSNMRVLVNGCILSHPHACNFCSTTKLLFFISKHVFLKRQHANKAGSGQMLLAAAVYSHS